MNKMAICLVFSFIFICNVHAEVSEDEIISQIKSAMNGDMTRFLESMDEIDKLSFKYARTQKEKCSGEFSSFILNEKGEKILQKKKLNKRDRKHCLYMLIKFRIRLTRILFKARYKYLGELHLIQQKDLKTIEKNTLKKLERLASKYQVR